MADNLKRVGLVFKEDGAVDFKKSLQEINLELNKNYNQFKLTQAQWDKSTESTQKLRAEQEYLKNAYEIQADKVNTLKMQLSDLENAENKNISAIKKKQNELATAEIKLENYNKKLKEIDNQLNNTGKKLEENGKKIEKWGSNIEKAGKKMSAFSIATGTALLASAKSAIDFEDAFTGVEKTVDGTAEQMEELKQGIRDMAKEIPSTTREISAVAEAAGQLGIKTEDILSFTRVMIDLGNSTNLSAEEAASSLAKFANVTKMSAKDYDKLGATIVALGNNFATTEADIVEMATRLAATGELAGLSESQILSLATAMSSVGIEAEAGGSAMSKLLKNIQLAVELGGDDLKDFAKVAGMTTKDFKKAFEEDAVKALSAFISGLNDTERNGKSAIAILDDMGITEVRLSNTVLSLANASDVMNKAVDLGNEAWEDNTALTNEANKRYDTLKSKITIAINKLKDMTITLGNKLMPSIEKVINKIGKWIEKFEDLSDEEVDMIVKLGLIVTATGPVITILGKLTSTVGGVVKGIGTFSQAIGVMKGTISTTSTAVNGLASIMSAVVTPTGLATVAIAGVTAGLAYFIAKQTESTKEFRELAKETENTKNALIEYNKQIDENVNTNLSHIESVDKLKDELALLADENGKVKEGEEGRVAFILNELNSALGTEYKLNENIIESYQKLKQEIETVIKAKRAEIILAGEEEKYTKAIEEEAEAVANLKDIREKLGMTLDEAKKKYAGLLYEYRNTRQPSLLGEMEDLRNLITSYEDTERTVKTYTDNKKQYEEDYALFIEGKYDEIGQNIKTSTEDWSKSTIETLQNAINEEKNNLETYKEIYKQTGNEVAEEQKQQSEERLKELQEELKNRTSTVQTLGQEESRAWFILANNNFDEYGNVIDIRTPELVTETQKMSEQVLEQIEKNPEFKAEAINNLKGLLNGLEDERLRELLKAAGVKDVDKVMEGIRNGNLAEDEGIDILKNLHKGLSNTSWKNSLWSTARGIASTLSGLLTVKANVNGNTSTLPGHKLGLDYVPKDNYVARLHKGERVLTKEENEAYTEAEERRVSNNNNIFSQEIDYNKMAQAITNALTNCKFTLDEDGFAKIVKDELYKVV